MKKTSASVLKRWGEFVVRKGEEKEREREEKGDGRRMDGWVDGWMTGGEWEVKEGLGAGNPCFQKEKQSE